MPKRQVHAQQALPPDSWQDRVVRIVQSARHGGVRTIITGNKHCETRSMPLIKGGGAIQTEAGVEPVFAKLMEMRPDVVRIVSQPYRVELTIEGAPCAMINDFALLYADGRREVVEIKGSPRKLRDPHYARKLELAGSAYAAHGLGFRVVTASDPEIADDVVRHNVDLAFVCRFVPVLEMHKTNAARLMSAACGETTLGRLGSVLHPNPLNGRAIAYAMMARRHVAIDMSRPFSDESRVRAVPPLPAHLPSLRL